MPGIFSDFELGTEGWTVIAGATPLENPPTGGDSGAFLRSSDDGTGIWAFRGGDEWSGDLSDNFGGILSFSVRQSLGTDYLDGVDVRITGVNGLELTYTFGTEVGTDWITRSVRIADFEGWRIDGGRIASESEIRSVLADVAAFDLRGDLFNGNPAGDFTDLDSVRLTRGRDLPGDQVFRQRVDDIWSSFASGGEGWGFTADVQEFRHVPTGGADGLKGNTGHIEHTDRATGAVIYFDAPAAYLGVRSGFIDGTLQYKLQLNDLSDPIAAAHPDVVITGANGQRIVTDLPGRPGTDWTDFGVKLNPSGGWQLNDGNGPAASRADIAGVLADIASLRILGEFRVGEEIVGLDEVRLSALKRPFDVLDDDGHLVATRKTLQAALDSMRRLDGTEVIVGADAAGTFDVSAPVVRLTDPSAHLSGTLNLLNGNHTLMVAGGGDLDILGNARGNTITVVDGGKVLASGGRGDDFITLDGTTSGTVLGERGADNLTGGDSSDRLVGGGQNDTLNGRGGNDTHVGGGGSDRFVFEENFGRDSIRDFTPGQDSLVLLLTGFETVDDLDGHFGNTAGGDLRLGIGKDSIIFVGIADQSEILSDILFA